MGLNMETNQSDLQDLGLEFLNYRKMEFFLLDSVASIMVIY